jgi:hydroxymethylbilane synthase
MAGLNRLGMSDVPASAIDTAEMLPAVAQGAIGIERRSDDARATEMLAALHHLETGQRLAAERAYLAALDGSCETPIAGLATLDGTTLTLRGEILRTDGSEALSDIRSGPIEDGAAIGKDLAESLLARAGDGFFDWKTAS